jgi:hypothetical protein
MSPRHRVLVALLVALALPGPFLASAEEPKVFRIGAADSVLE